MQIKLTKIIDIKLLYKIIKMQMIGSLIFVIGKKHSNFTHTLKLCPSF